MKHWWQFDRDEDRLAYIRSVRKLTEFSDKDPDFRKNAKHNPEGEIAYIKDEMKKLIFEGISKGGIVRSWIEDDKCKTFPDVEKVILKLWNGNKKEVEENWNDSDPQVSFDKQLFTFFRIYFPYVRLAMLLKEYQRKTVNGNLLRMVNDQLRGRFESDLKILDENNFQNWGQGGFSAVCYHIYNAKQRFKYLGDRSFYIKQKETSFEAFKRELAAYFNRKAPSHDRTKSRKELEKLTQEKKDLLKELFS